MSHQFYESKFKKKKRVQQCHRLFDVPEIVYFVPIYLEGGNEKKTARGDKILYEYSYHTLEVKGKQLYSPPGCPEAPQICF